MLNLKRAYISPKEISKSNDELTYKSVFDAKSTFEPPLIKTDYIEVKAHNSNGNIIKFLVLSDIHGNWNTDEITNTITKHNIDAFIYAGDIINHDNDITSEVNKSLNAIRKIGSIVPSFIVAGNHDEWINNYPQHYLEQQFSPAYYIENECFTFKNIRFFGTPMTASETNEKLNNFMRYNPNKLNPFGNMPKDVEVIISHGGPTGMQTYNNVQYGDSNLRRLINHPSSYLKACLFGHMHNNSGFRLHKGVVCLNASQMDNETFVYRPFILSIEK